MMAANLSILCLAYIAGLLLTALPGQLLGLSVGAIALLLLGVAASLLVSRVWRTGPSSRIWLLAGLTGLIASLYFQIQFPRPGATDISRLIPSSEAIASELVFTVSGQIESPPRLTRSQNIQFWLKAKQVRAETKTGAKALAERAISGKIYTTVPLLMGTGLHPGEVVTVTGSLYKPKPATNPGGFDFQAYLEQEGGFTGMRGNQVESSEPAPWGLWAVRQRIVRSQVQQLGVPEGPLLSAMVMGKNGVDVPYDLRDAFAKAGLAHALAASGFQVSLVIGVILSLTKSLAARVRLGLGLSVLILYIGLTGAEPSVLRAGVMGVAVLLATTLERKVKPLGSMLIAATLLLVIHPIWIWNLGFQLSFLATLGLLVTTPTLTRWLDWLPPTLAGFIAVPVAAYIWTMPLQLHVFGVVSPYSIVANVLTAPLLTVVSLGGMVSALAALVVPGVGSTLAGLLYYPTRALIAIAEFCNQLPGNSFAVSTISTVQVVALYGLICLIWWRAKWQQYWWVAVVAGLSLIAIPVGYAYTNLSQVTILAGDPVLVLQDKGKVALINSGDEANATFSVMPFLTKQGVNRVEWAIATQQQSSNLAGWYPILKSLPVQTFYDNGDPPDSSNEVESNSASTAQTLLSKAIDDQLKNHQGKRLSLSVDQPVLLGKMAVTQISAEPPVLQLQTDGMRWLLLPNIDPADQQTLVAANLLPEAQAIWWFGRSPMPALLDTVQPDVAIASSAVNPETTDWFSQHAVPLYQTRQDGAVRWNAKQGFATALLANDPN
ncbi:ComEC/Rec2 family competence protein [Oculatella sp. LEGE 06141]|uniref:ComEC/Rec2 family competence protein n=1 Tax=Oculatella sp. LEGE 06141 TaxID=1828648 RepID=UPI00187F5E07|nr:ComEC/Rec2 family competence protein [Oculatella sp. LEGE 06141]MBE9179587.1 ComEC/Rec2 family competence protein [Oculatella sp. LEGE 06141]